MGVSVNYDLPVSQLLRHFLFIVHQKQVCASQGKSQVMGQMLRPLLIIISPDYVERRIRSFGFLFVIFVFSPAISGKPDEIIPVKPVDSIA